MKNNNGLILVLIVLIIAIARPDLADQFVLGVKNFGATQETIVITATPMPTEYTVEDVAQAFTQTPPASTNNGAVATAMPPQTRLSVGDITKLEQSLKGSTVEQTDLNITTLNSHRSVGTWCYTDHINNILNRTPYDPDIPDPIQMRDGIISEVKIPKRRLCIAKVKEGTISAGIPSVTFSQLSFYSIEEINAMQNQPPLPYVTYEEITNAAVQDPIGRPGDTVITNNLKFTLHVEFGFFNVSTTPDNQSAPIFLDSPLGIVQDGKDLKAWAKGIPGYDSTISLSILNAERIADYGLITPITYGDDFKPIRDMSYLESTVTTLRQAYSEGGAPYTRIYSDIQAYASVAGYVDVQYFYIDLVYPGPEKYYWLYPLSEGRLNPVIKEGDLAFIDDNFYPLFASELPKP